MTDVLLFNTDDGGELIINNGDVGITNDLDTAVYLSLFGGNDDGSQWWGRETGWPKCLTQQILQSKPLTSSMLLKIADAVKNDLQWLSDQKILSDLAVLVSAPALNRVQIAITAQLTGTGAVYAAQYRMPI